MRISYACSQAWDVRIHKGCPVHAKIRKRHQDIAADLPIHTTSAIHTYRALAEHSYGNEVAHYPHHVGMRSIKASAHMFLDTPGCPHIWLHR